MPDCPPPIIDKKRCSGCGRCVAACQELIITLETTNHHKSAKLTDPQRCTACGACIEACPIEAIGLKEGFMHQER